jgi:ABC-2 type transport system ATP-binding protein
VIRRWTVFLLLAVAGALAGATAAGAAPKIEDDIVVRSFDGTPIVATLMLPDGASAGAPVPVVLNTHGWGGRRQTTSSGTVGELVKRGYAVLTYDSRGFGESGGEANVGSVDFEAKDAGALMDYLAARPEILLDRPGDPRVGWYGGSNAGGVQLNTAAVDDRVDVIVPVIAWGDLPRDLIPNGVAKQTWDELLYGAGAAGAAAEGIGSAAGPQTGVYAREIHIGHAQLAATGSITDDIRSWFAARSTTARSDDVRIPTFIIQGSIDTLFPLEDGFENYSNVASGGAPVKLMTYCSGHTITGCTYPGGASGYPDGAAGRAPLWEQRVLSWFDKHLKGLDVDTGPEIEWQAQDGYFYGAPKFPLPGTKLEPGAPVSAGTLIGPGGTGGDGPANGAPARGEELGVTAARAVILGPPRKATPILGIPQVRLEGNVVGVAAHVYLELVDAAPDGTRVTVDDQTMPVRLGAGAIDETVELHGVSWILRPGHSLELEITTGSAQYAPPRTGPFAVSLTASPALPLAPTGFASPEHRSR